MNNEGKIKDLQEKQKENRFMISLKDDYTIRNNYNLTLLA